MKRKFPIWEGKFKFNYYQTFYFFIFFRPTHYEQGYTKFYGKQIDKDFKKRIEFFSLLWFLKVYNFEVDKIRKGEQLVPADKRFPPKDVYIYEIKKILEL